MKKLCAIICVLLTAAMLPVIAFAQTQTNQSENLSQFKARLKQEQEATGFLDEWNNESKDLFAGIAKDSGIDIVDPDKHEAWLTAYHALQNVFEQVWGEMCIRDRHAGQEHSYRETADYRR